MTNWIVHQTIQCHNLHVLGSHPPSAQSKDAVLEFIATFDHGYKRVWIRGNYYSIIPAIIAKALKCSHHYHTNVQLCKNRIKDYNLEAIVQALGESLYYEG